MKLRCQAELDASGGSDNASIPEQVILCDPGTLEHGLYINLNNIIPSLSDLTGFIWIPSVAISVHHSLQFKDIQRSQGASNKGPLQDMPGVLNPMCRLRASHR